jgi:hypothetical protein
MIVVSRSVATVSRASLLLSLIGCAPRLRPLTGTEVKTELPPARMPAGSQLIVLDWELNDPDLVARGDAAARVTSPDSARLDFFLGGGMGSGATVLIGDSLRFPSDANDMGRRLVPPAPLLWAALGRLALPASADTSVRASGDTLRADIGQPVAWRVTFVRDTLWRVERAHGDRVVEWVQRFDASRVRYRQEVQRRQLDLTVTRTESVSAFDPAIWDLP